MNINANTTRHGKAVAIALFLEIERMNRGMEYGKHEQETRDTIAAYLNGYASASAKARGGFVFLAGAFAAMPYGCGFPILSTYQEKRVRPPISDAERKAHARVWLQGGAA